MGAGRMRVSAGSGPGPTRPCGRHQIALAAGKKRSVSSPGAVKLFRCSLVHDQDPTAWPYRGASVPQRLNRAREVVHALDEQHQVIAR